VGISGLNDVSVKAKPLSDFSKAEQTKLLRQQTIIQTLIDRLESN